MSGFTHLGAARRAFDEYPGVWFFCGGCALDLFMGNPVRTRHDVDIGILRDEQDLLKKHFPGIDIYWVSPKTKWHGERLELPVHEMYVHVPGEPLEVLLNEATERDWVYRRDARITRPIHKAVLTNEDTGIPFLTPEIVLLYKSKHMREKDIFDFNAVRAALSDGQRAWLKQSLDRVYLGAHPWSAEL